MKVITRESLAKDVYKLWSKQYPLGKYPGKDIVTSKLKLLGDNPAPDDIDITIGNESWTKVPECSECGWDFVKVVMVGDEPDYDSSTVYLCASCVNKAFTVMSEFVKVVAEEAISSN